MDLQESEENLKTYNLKHLNFPMKNQAKTTLAIIIVILALIIIFMPSGNVNPIACTQEAKLCADGMAVSRNSSLGCEFDACPIQDKVFCTPEQRQVDACIEIYQPVCGWNNPDKIQCIKFPCANTYSNSCFACQDENVEYWTEGECPNE